MVQKLLCWCHVSMGFGGIYMQHQIREDFEGDFGNCREMETYAGGIGTFPHRGGVVVVYNYT